MFKNPFLIFICFYVCFKYIVVDSYFLQNKKLNSPKNVRDSFKLNSTPSSSIVNKPLIIVQNDKFSSWPCGDELDKKIIQLAIPAILNFAIVPLVGAVDTFWVGKMNNALALAGQGAANQIFSSSFYIISFLPSVVAPLVAKAAGSGDTEGLQQRVAEAFFIGSVMGLIGMALLFGIPSTMLSMVLSSAAPAREFALPYLLVRAISFIPSLLASVCFAAFRGTLDFVTPLKISLISNIINVILDPILIFKAGLGVTGAAAATCVAEVIAIVMYIQELLKRNMLRGGSIFKVPSFAALKPLLVGGFNLQIRAIALNIAFLAVTRTAQSLDSTGIAAAAHVISLQFWQLGGIILLAMSSVASILVPISMANVPMEVSAVSDSLPTDSQRIAKNTADRLMLWGVLLGAVLSSLQLLSLPLLNTFSALPEVQAAARLPSILGSALNLLNGVIFIGEGIQLGHQRYWDLGACTVLASIGMLTSLKLIGKSLPGVWASIGVFNLIRLVGVLRHHFLSGPVAGWRFRRVKT